MDPVPAPFHADLARGPEGATAHWVWTVDGVRLRIVHWPGAGRGTVLIFPGRTEPAEKYGPTAVAMMAGGFACLVIDWRGQGLSDRALADPMVGHVGDFAEYQRDVDAMLALAETLGAAGPFCILSHSMGGAIALRAMIRLPGQFRAAVFSAPMWGIRLSPAMRPVARIVSTLARWVGQSHRYAPTTGGTSYLVVTPFEGNVLTRDPEIYAWMRDQMVEAPALQLGGPSLGWLRAAMEECAALAVLPSPNLPVICALGTVETVVDPVPVHARMAQWGMGQLDLYPGAAHEVPMEVPAVRRRFHQRAVTLFQGAR
ncbi:MAG: alpha/beta hydrolase [Pseudomonadota bacterium]